MVTAISTAAQLPDAVVVKGVLDGDPSAFATLYERYADGLHDFCYTILRDHDRATVVVRQVFGQLPALLARRREWQHLEPWLYATARDEALRRAGPASTEAADPETMTLAVSEDERERALLEQLASEAELAVSGRDRALLSLHLRHGLNTTELASAAGISERRIGRQLERVRDRVERRFIALLVTRWNRPGCGRLDRVLVGWTGRLTPRLVQRVAAHVGQCPTCDESRRTAPSPLVLLAAAPQVSAPPVLRELVLGNVSLDLPGQHQPARRNWINPRIVAGLVVLALAGGVVVIWRDASTPAAARTPAAAITAPIPRSATLRPPPPASPSAAPSSAPLPPAPVAPPSSAAAQDRSSTVRPPANPPPAPAPVDPPPPRPAPGANLAVVGQSASPTAIGVRGCAPDRSTITAVLSGSPALVLLVWRDSTGRTGATSMQRNGGSWVAPIGPFDAPGAVSWKVAGGDASGAKTQGETGTLLVAPCPR